MSFVDRPGVTSNINSGAKSICTGVPLEGSHGEGPQVDNTGVPDNFGSVPKSHPATNITGISVIVELGPKLNIEVNNFNGCGTSEQPFVYIDYDLDSETNKTAHSDNGDMEDIEET